MCAKILSEVNESFWLSKIFKDFRNKFAVGWRKLTTSKEEKSKTSQNIS